MPIASHQALSYSKNSIDPVSDYVKYRQVILVYKCIHIIVLEYLHDMFSIKLDSKRYNLWSSNTGRLAVPKKHNIILAFNVP